MIDTLGKAGEYFARYWFEQHGYIILAQNWRLRTGEIDLIAIEDGTIVFIEVKTLAHTQFADLDVIISKRKQLHISETAKYFLATNREYNKMNMRFDVLVIPFDPRIEKYSEPVHLKNAFEDYI